MAPRIRLARFVPALLLLVAAREGRAQGLPELAPLNPMGSSRTGLYFQPFIDPAPGRWVTSIGLDYASVIEYNRLPPADYVLDSELLRVALSLRRDLGARSFLTLQASAGGAYAGFMDGFLDWYHGALGIRVTERERRPRDRYLYTITVPSESTLVRSRSDFFLQDLRVGWGVRHGSRSQTVLSATLPTSTGPDGFGRGVPSLSLLHTFRSLPANPVIFEGSVGVGFTPRHGEFRQEQRQVLFAATSGLRYRVWGRQSLYANLFYHTPYYSNTTLPALDLRELSLDFGWILKPRRGGEWRIGLTEDLEPGGPGVDVVLRFGRSF